MATKMFVNFAVKDLKNTMDFFSKLGFLYNPQFTDDNAACMVINDDCSVMLLAEAFFKTFTKKELVDAHKSTEALIAISADSKDKVNEILDKALAMGATEVREPQDHGFMFGRSFSDLDGHIWEIIWMDQSVMK